MATLLSDLFTGADGQIDGRTPTEDYVAGSPTWTQKGGTVATASIVSNQVKGDSTSINSIYTLESGVADCEIYVDVIPSATGGDWAGIVFRLSDDDNFYQARTQWNGATNILTLQKIEAGSYSAIVSGLDIGGNSSTPYTMRIELVADAIEIFIDGVSQYTTSQAFNQTATKHGIYVLDSTRKLDNFYITDAAGIGENSPPGGEIIDATWAGNVLNARVANVGGSEGGDPPPPPPPAGAYTLGFNLNDPNWFNSVSVFNNLAKTASFYANNATGGTISDATGNPVSGATQLNIQTYGGKKLQVGTYDINWTGAGTGPATMSVAQGDGQKSLNFNGEITSPSIIRQGATGTYTPTFSARANATSCIRFMDAQRVNYVEYDSANEWVRKKVGFNNTFWHKIMTPTDIGNMSIAFDIDVWVCIHHLATDADVTAYAQALAAVMSGTGRVVYVEHSNECWNGAFPQTSYCDSQPEGRSGYHANRSDEIAELFKAEFLAGEVVGVLGSQLDSTGLFNGMVTQATRPLSFIDAVAVAPYVGGPPARGVAPYGKTPSEIANMTSAQIVDQMVRPDFENRVKAKCLTWQANAATKGWRLLGYEAGTHLEVTDHKNNTAAQGKLDAASQSAEMGVFYGEYLDWWQANINDYLMLYMDVSTGDGKPWGHKEYELDPNSPRWQAVIDRMET